ncbi:MAG TPA: hypothetical protein VE954_29465, partial [Oligoflexus sp.]|uniref:hypothetical protein n=1 Tax=Oligoflexus sp. TaxID=1971216 RepID=UPI002D6C59BE
KNGLFQKPHGRFLIPRPLQSWESGRYGPRSLLPDFALRPQILVSDAIIQYLDAHNYRAVREFQLKGIEKPIMLYEIVAGQPAELPETIPVSSKSA